jgi:hypothetical protein
MTPAATGTLDEQSTLEAWLIGRGKPPPAHVIRKHDLSAWAYVNSRPGDPLHGDLRSDFHRMLRRHYEIRRELLDLFTAWNAAGIDVLPFKGFWLSETCYPVPGARFHGDVDVLFRDSQASDALRVAEQLGWLNVSAIKPRYSHCVFNLTLPGGHARIDGHRYPIHSRVRINPAQRRVTQAMWSAAQRQQWHDVQVFAFTPIDTILVLMLQRGWGEKWRLKPADPIDLQMLVQKHKVERAAVLARARELGCTRTVRIFLERCDPWAGRLDLTTPAGEVLRGYYRAAAVERPLLAFEANIRRMMAVPAVLHDIISVLPSLMRVRWLLLRRRPITELLHALMPKLPDTNDAAIPQRIRIVRGGRLAARLLRGTTGECLLRSLVLFHALRARGWEVTLVTGVRRIEGRLTGHAWVELNGDLLPELHERLASQYTVSFRYPPGRTALTTMEAHSIRQ